MGAKCLIDVALTWLRSTRLGAHATVAAVSMGVAFVAAILPHSALEGAARPNQEEPAGDDASGERPDASNSVAQDSSTVGRQLFVRHCAPCHGDNGDGNGAAAAFLFPKPRNFRTGLFRLVSTDNNVPTRDDLNRLLLRGMPGSSMPPWAHLPQAQRDALVDEVLRLRADGAREEYIWQLREWDGLTDEEIADEEMQEEINDLATEAVTPGETTDAPTIGRPTPEAIAHGRQMYAKFACISCHGETGRGDGVQEMWDDDKLPTRPRDFTLGVFKGDHDAASLYRRIAYGMPGTPMPGSSGMTPEELADLVHYVRSLSSEEQRQAAILKRKAINVRLVGKLPGEGATVERLVASEIWSRVQPVDVNLTPLWWRNDAAPDIMIQAIHDGETMAVRLTWKDETADLDALRSEAFEDAVAMQLFRGEGEPFLGMGDGSSPVDVWFWDADRQRGNADEPYPRAVVDVFPFSERAVDRFEIDRVGAKMSDQPDISLPARASGNLIVPRAGEPTGASSLQVGGPGTVTFRPPQSQLVSAHGAWSDGRWTVVMTRRLSVDAGEGVSLTPGGRASAALAVWDGSHHDRDGQKSISIWQDLTLE